MTKSKVSAKILLKLKEIFEELGWDTKEDPAFNRFSKTLEFLDSDQQELFLELTRNFLKIDIAKYHVYLRKALRKIGQSILSNIETIYIAPLIAKKDLGKSKSSTMVSRFLVGRELGAKEILGVKSLFLIDRLSDFKFPDKNNWLFILVDDFVGTGETASEAIDELLQDFQIDQNKIIVLSLVAQETGYLRVSGKGLNFICAELRKKGISDGYLSPTKERYISIMKSIEDLIRVKDEFRFGYRGSEALITLDRTPNNTFPVYWLEKKIQGKRFVAPFPRD